GWRLGNDAGLCFALGGRHLPLIGSGLDQHLTRGRATLADILLRPTNAAAAARGHVSPNAIARQVLAGRWVFDFYLLPVAVELLGHQLSKPCRCALAHFRSGNADHDRIVGPDEHPRTYLVAF